jgi:hypothetical protein
MVFSPIEQNREVADDVSMKRSRTDDSSSSHWQRLFATLQNERVTQAEENLTAFCQESERREDALKTYIAHLESELRAAKQTVKLCESQAKDIIELQSKNEELETTIKIQHATILKQVTRLEEKELIIEQQCQTLLSLENDCKAAKDTVESATTKVKEQENALQCYKMLTATTFVVSNNKMECTVTNEDKNTFMKFNLKELENKSDMKYVPIANVTVLPKFLHQAVEFPKSDTPSFLQLVLKGLFPE